MPYTNILFYVYFSLLHPLFFVISINELNQDKDTYKYTATNTAIILYNVSAKDGNQGFDEEVNSNKTEGLENNTCSVESVDINAVQTNNMVITLNMGNEFDYDSNDRYGDSLSRSVK